MTEGGARRHAVWALCAVAYLYSFPYFERLNSPNENVRVYMTRALVEHRTLAINRVEAEWGWVNDKAKSGERVYSGKAPGASFLGVPVLVAQRWLWSVAGARPPSKRAVVFALRIGATALPIIAFLFWVARYVERRSGSPAVRDLAVLGLGLGSMLYPYGVQFVGHAVAAALSAGAFMLLAPVGGGRPRPGATVAAGLLAGLGVVFEYQNIIPAALLLAFAWAQGGARGAARFAAGAAPAAVALGVYHTLCFGRPWAFPYGHLENADFQTYHVRGFHGFALPRVEVLGHILFSIDYGLFAFSPFLLLGVAAVARALVAGPRREALVVGAVLVGMLLFLAGMGNWRGGWTVGPRYIVVVVPLLVLAWAFAPPMGVGGPAVLDRVIMTVGAALVLVSVALNLSAGAIYPHFPPQLRNPVFQLVVPLVADGYVPYNAGRLVGLAGRASLVPLAAAAVAAALLALTAIARSAGDRRRRALMVVLALVVAAGVLAAYSRYARRQNVSERSAVSVVRSLWEPR